MMGVAVASAGSYTNHLHLTHTDKHTQHLITNQQCQSTEGNHSQQISVQYLSQTKGPIGITALKALKNAHVFTN